MPEPSVLPSTPREPSRLRLYLEAVLAAGAATAVRYLLDQLLGEHHPFLTALLAVMFIAWRGGLGPGLLTLVLSGAAAIYLFIPPRGSFQVGGPENQIGLALFCFAGVGCALLGELQRSAERQARTAFGQLSSQRRSLEDEVLGRRRVEEDLRRSESRFRVLAESVPQLLWTAGPDGRLDYFNQRWYDYTGLTPEQSLDAGWSAALHPDDHDGTLRRWQDAVRGGQPYEIEYRLRRSDGSYRWFLGRALPQRDASGRVASWFGTCTDIDDQQRQQQELRQSEARFRLLSEAIPQMVWTAEPSGDVVYYNQRWYDYTGLGHEETRDQGWQQVIHPDDREEGVRAWQDALRRGDHHQVEQRLRRGSDGAYRWHLVRGRPLRDGQGRIVQWVGTITDVDDQRRYRENLERLVAEQTADLIAANEALIRSNRELEQFASVASHDLQEPLRKIQTFGDRLRSRAGEALGGQEREYLQRILSAATRMRSLIDALLTYSRVTTKAQPFVPVDLTEVAHEVVSDLEGLLQHVGGAVEVGPLPTVDADPLQMRQLLQNLIGNGLKFRRPGVTPVVRLEGRELPPDGDTPARAEVTVSDNGIGFEQEYAEKIFGLFQRLHGRNEYEGTGMGLAICRKIAERHGGGITARSSPGQGATFIVTLPLRQTREGGEGHAG